MDEIDAALDFKNVSIVANYIKERTQNAQFIIISLRNNMFELADRLVGVFRSEDTAPADFPHLMAQSRGWSALAEAVFSRLDELAEAAGAEGGDPEEELELRRLARQLRGAHADVRGYDETLRAFFDLEEEHWEGAVALRRKELSSGFFAFVKDKVQLNKDDPDELERFANAGARISSLCHAYDEVSSDGEAMREAQQNFEHVLDADTPEAFDGRIDDLASRGKIDPAFLMLSAKAYSGVKQTDLVEDDVKDIMKYLYDRARDSFYQDEPAEVKILKYVCSLTNRAARREALQEAFTPGSNYTDGDTEYLSTTPDALLRAVDRILFTYERQRLNYDAAAPKDPYVLGPNKKKVKGSDLVRDMKMEAEAIMAPNAIERLYEIRVMVRSEFMTGQDRDEGDDMMGWMLGKADKKRS